MQAAPRLALSPSVRVVRTDLQRPPAAVRHDDRNRRARGGTALCADTFRAGACGPPRVAQSQTESGDGTRTGFDPTAGLLSAEKIVPTLVLDGVGQGRPAKPYLDRPAEVRNTGQPWEALRP